MNQNTQVLPGYIPINKQLVFWSFYWVVWRRRRRACGRGTDVRNQRYEYPRMWDACTPRKDQTQSPCVCFLSFVFLIDVHCYNVIMGAMASQITSLTSVCSAICLMRRSKKTSKLRVTGPCVGNSPVTGEFPAHRTSNAKNVSIWWRHHGRGIWCVWLSWG